MIVRELSGTAYEMGYALGSEFAEYYKKVVAKCIEPLKDEGIVRRVNELKQKLSTEFIDAYEEIKGRAAGAKVDEDCLFLLMFPEVLRLSDGCTTVMVRNTRGDILFSHNEDDKGVSEENAIFLKYNYGDYMLAGYTILEKLIGPCFGFNSYGLVFSSNMLMSDKVNLDHISRYIMERKVYEAKSLDEAVEVLKSLEVASAFSMNIVDSNTLEAVNVEKDIDEIYVTYLKDRYARSNHFLSYPDSKREANTVFRATKAKELVDRVDLATVTLDEVKSILDYHTNDFFASIRLGNQDNGDGAMTLANASFDTRDKKMKILDYIEGGKEYCFEL